MTSDPPDCPSCGTVMELGDWVEDPPDGGPRTYFYQCPDCQHKSYAGEIDSRGT